jgi:hypothetical protein
MINTATFKIYQFTCDHYSQMDYDSQVELTPESVCDYFERMMEECASEDYDVEWFALIATKAIKKTIDWDFIARKHAEKAIIKMKGWEEL